MSKISLLFVRKFANSQLLAAFPASISKILAFFPFAPVSCKGLKLFILQQTYYQPMHSHAEHGNENET